MKALLCEAFGPPEQLVIKDVAVPEVGLKDVRIKIMAAGINFPDGLIIQNQYQVKPNLPFSPGSEVAGIVDAVGAEVKDFKPGDRVIAMSVYGGLAQMVVVGSEKVVALPDHVSFEIGAGLLMAYGTSIHALKQRAQLREGETLLVLGAAGGVSLAAVELGKALGARVIAAASSKEKLHVAHAHGADILIDYSEGDFRAKLKAAAGEKGIDVIYDPVGGELAEQSFRNINREGRFLVIGFASGNIPSFPLNLPLLKSASVVGVFWGAFTMADTEAHRQNMAEIFALLAQNKMQPHIGRTFGFEESAAAIRWVMDRKAIGKVVVSMAI